MYHTNVLLAIYTYYYNIIIIIDRANISHMGLHTFELIVCVFLAGYTE